MSVDNIAIMKKMKEIAVNSGEFECDICIGDYVNESSEAASKGWIGIYKKDVSYEPGTLGVQASLNKWTYEGEFTIVIQFATMASGLDCYEGLDELVNKFADVLFQNVEFAGLVDNIKALEIRYDYNPATDSDGNEAVYFQTAFMDLTIEVDRR